MSKISQYVDKILEGIDVKKILQLESNYNPMTKDELYHEYVEEDTDKVWIIVEVGYPENPSYSPEEVYIVDVDWDKEIVQVSHTKNGRVWETLPIDEIFATEHDAEEAIIYLQ